MRKLLAIPISLALLVAAGCPGAVTDTDPDGDGVHEIRLSEDMGVDAQAADAAPFVRDPMVVIDRARTVLADAGIAEHEHFRIWHGTVKIRHIRADGTARFVGEYNVVTTVGLEFLVDAFQGTTEPETANFHAVGVGDGAGGCTAKAAGDTALQSESLMGNADRGDGTQGENGTTTYQSVATMTNNSGGAVELTEAGLFTADAAGTLFAAQCFASINLADGDSIETTWEITVS